MTVDGGGAEQKARDRPRAQGLKSGSAMMENWSARHKGRSGVGQRAVNRTGWPNKQAPFAQGGNGEERELLWGALHCSCGQLRSSDKVPPSRQHT